MVSIVLSRAFSDDFHLFSRGSPVYPCSFQGIAFLLEDF